MCQWEQFDSLTWPSSTDQTDRFPGIVCVRLEGRLPGTSWDSISTFWRIVKLVEAFPI